jgi:lysophospholipase L1-like esterase
MRTVLDLVRRCWRQLAVAALLTGIFAGWLCYESRWAIHAARLARTAAADKTVPPKVPAPPADMEHLKLYLPKALYAFPGIELKVYFESLVPPALADQLLFQVKCPAGTTARRYWSATFTPDQSGVHPWEIIVSNFAGRELARATCEVRVAQTAAGQGKHLRLLIVGDSLTHATWYSNRLSDLCERPGNPQLEMIGTHKPAWAKPGVAHEGYNGWTWAHFLRHDMPGKFLNGTPDKSPFLFRDSVGGKPKFDLPRYLRETSPAGLPDLVIFQLGINDVFSQLPYEGYLFSPDDDRLTPNIDQLLQEFRAAAPQTSLAIWLTQPVNATQESFESSYRGLEDYRGIQRNKMALRQHWIADQILHRYGGRESEGLYLIPMSATVDPLDDFPASDSVHPSIPGYQRIGEGTYAWIKWWIDDASGAAARLELASKPATTEKK